ncbi:MAG: hypothetical protein Q9211_006467 [Gyalolechia sp. 1 TL-2023]
MSNVFLACCLHINLDNSPSNLFLMYTRKNLERVCQSSEFEEDKADTVYSVLKAVSTSRTLFSDLVTRLFEHADPNGRDSILRALGNSVADIGLEKLLCPDREEDVHELFGVMALMSFEKQKARPVDIGRVQDALRSDNNLPPLPSDEGSLTPTPSEMRTAKWISDQNTLRSNHDKKRKRDDSDNGSDEHAEPVSPKPGPRERSSTRRPPKRASKGTKAAQSAVHKSERNLRPRKVAKPEGNQHPVQGICEPTVSNGNIPPRRSARLKRR